MFRDGRARGLSEGLRIPRCGVEGEFDFGYTAGSFVLDEIGTLGLDKQGLPLRALEEKRFLPLGTDPNKR